MTIKILIGVVAVLVVLAVVVASRPSKFHIERSVTIAAPAEVPFALVNNFHSWRQWSAYETIDPELKRDYSGAESGVGASYTWKGNSDVGQGRMTIQRSEPASHIVIRLDFEKPMSATNTATFTFVPTTDGTKVTWAMDGDQSFICKAFSLFMDMDKMVGGDFEKGLLTMKALCESNTIALAAQ